MMSDGARPESVCIRMEILDSMDRRHAVQEEFVWLEGQTEVLLNDPNMCRTILHRLLKSLMPDRRLSSTGEEKGLNFFRDLSELAKLRIPDLPELPE